MFIHDTLDFTRLHFENKFVQNIYESTWAKIELGKNLSVIVGSIYRPTTYLKRDLDRALEIHCAILDEIKSKHELKFCKVYLTGDYNLDLIKTDLHSPTAEYVDSLYNLGFLPCITRPTRIQDKTRTLGRSATLLDHIFSDSTSVKFAGILVSDLSDHFPVFLIDQIRSPEYKKIPTFKRDTSDSKILEFSNLLKAQDWTSVTENTDPILAADDFFCKLKNATDLAFPKIEVKARRAKIDKKVPWITFGLLKSAKNKNKLYRKKVSNPSVVNCETYLAYKRIYNSVCKTAKKLYLSEKFESCAKNSRETWRNINSTLGRQTKNGQSLPTIFKSGNKVFSTPEQISNGFNDFFADVGSNLAKKIVNNGPGYQSFLGKRCNNDFR